MGIGRSFDFSSLRALLAAGLIAALVLPALAAQAQGQTRMDYGDAPDGADARYSSAVLGKFPSLLASSGPRHRGGGPSLGIGRDKEGDSKQVDRDRFDDGVSLDRLGRCGNSRLTVLIDTRRIPARLLRKHDLYFNSWFDWDRSGAWGEWNRCPDAALLRNNEWSIVNQRISGKAFLRKRVRAFSFRFKAGLHSGEFWFRTTLTLGQKLPIDPASRSGAATVKPFAFGETEDYLFQRSPGGPPEFPDPSGKEKKKETKKEKREREEREEKELEEKPFRVSCVPNPATVEHGKAATVRFFVKDEGKGNIFGKRLSPKRPGGNPTRIVRHSNQRGVPRGFFRAAGFRFKSSHRDARHNPVERHVLKFGFQRGKFKQVLDCVVNVIHDKIVEPKKPHRPKPVQPLQPPPPVVPPPPQIGQQPSVNGFGAYQQSAEQPQNYNVSVHFNQDVEGFKIKLKGGPPPNVTFVQVVPPTPGGISCEKADAGSVLCTGALKAGTQAHLVVQFDTGDPTAVGGRLELCAIQDGKEIGPFPMTHITVMTTG